MKNERKVLALKFAVKRWPFTSYLSWLEDQNLKAQKVN